MQSFAPPVVSWYNLLTYLPCGVGEGETMGRTFVLLLLLALVAYMGYNQWKMDKMRRDLEAITSRVHRTGPNSSGQSDLVTPLAKAELHTRKAKDMIKKNRPAEAQKELDYALKNLEQANGVSRDIVGEGARYIGKAREKAISLFQETWKEISEDPGKKKQGN